MQKCQPRRIGRRERGNWTVGLHFGRAEETGAGEQDVGGAGRFVEVVLCIVRLVTGLEKSPLAEVLTRHRRHGHALGIYLVVVVGCLYVRRSSCLPKQADTCGALYAS